MGRTRLRWLEDVQKDLREKKVKRWREKAFDREEWAFIIKEAKAMIGLWNQSVSKYIFLREDGTSVAKHVGAVSLTTICI